LPSCKRIDPGVQVAVGDVVGLDRARRALDLALDERRGAGPEEAVAPRAEEALEALVVEGPVALELDALDLGPRPLLDQEMGPDALEARIDRVVDRGEVEPLLAVELLDREGRVVDHRPVRAAPREALDVLRDHRREALVVEALVAGELHLPGNVALHARERRGTAGAEPRERQAEEGQRSAHQSKRKVQRRPKLIRS